MAIKKTGYYDKHGVEICEGNDVKWLFNDEIYTVYWDDDVQDWSMKHKLYRNEGDTTPLDIPDAQELEIAR